MKYTFSHNDTQENAQQTKDRTANANAINKVSFIALLGQSELSELIETIGTPEGYSQKGDLVWASIGNIDYVFKLTKIVTQTQKINNANNGNLNVSRLPHKAMSFRNTSSAIAEFVSVNQDYYASDYPWAKKMLGKFPLPPWQRNSVWTMDQKVSFIQSAYLGYDLGSVVINDYITMENDKLAKFSDCLLDGQQRIETIFDYTNNKFPVYGLFWKELNRSEQNRFLMCEIGKRMVNCFDEEKLKQVYNHLNFSGTIHKESERA